MLIPISITTKHSGGADVDTKVTKSKILLWVRVVVRAPTKTQKPRVPIAFSYYAPHEAGCFAHLEYHSDQIPRWPD